MRVSARPQATAAPEAPEPMMSTSTMASVGRGAPVSSAAAILSALLSSTSRHIGGRLRTASSSDQSPCSTVWPFGKGDPGSRPSDLITRSSR